MAKDNALRLAGPGRVVLGGAVALLVLLATLSLLPTIAYQGTPFQMAFRGRSGGTVVQFVRPDLGVVSPEFPIGIPGPTPPGVVLDGRPLGVPGCRVEFSDTTILPGRVRILIGKVLFDVMESRVEVGGKRYDWLPR